MRFGVVCMTLAAFLRPAVAADQPAPGARRNFVACPIVRDTKTVPCWLAEYEGEMYFLGIQVDTGAEFFPPQLLHEALVEGTVASGPRVCGGIPLNPVKVSVLPEINRSCNTMLPAEPSIEAPPAPRGPGPSNPRNRLVLEREKPPAPVPPYQAKEFTLYYDFDSDYLPSRMSRIVEEAEAYAKAIHASRVEVMSYRGSTLLSNGKSFVESPRIAELRAQQLGQTLRTLGIPADTISVQWKSEPEPGDGVSDPAKRRTTILVKP
jgi:outer membrane protein OmpA-like peptidoglycan-associated protein